LRLDFLAGIVELADGGGIFGIKAVRHEWMFAWVLSDRRSHELPV
jgi:hypothetical protein